MDKINRITMITLSLLLCAVLAATAVFSGTLAKYVTQKNFDHDLNFSNWQIDMNFLNDLNSEYIKGSTQIMVKSSNKQNVVAPGTRGALMCLHLDGNIGVESELDFAGTFSIGNGFFSSSRLVRDKNGYVVDYFPIIINVYTLDVVKSENLEDSTDIVWDEKRNDIVINNTSDNFTYDKTLVGSYGMQAGDDENVNYTVFSSVAEFNNVFNGKLNSELDEASLNDIILDRYYVIEWEWPYEAPEGSTYQTNHLDTSLCEAVAANKETNAFEISLDIEVTLSQKIVEKLETTQATEQQP